MTRRRLRQADRPGRHHDDRRRRHRRRLRRHVGRVGLRHQRAALLHRGLRLLRREVHRGAQGAEQRGLARGRSASPRRRAASSTPSSPRRSRRATSPARCCPTSCSAACTRRCRTACRPKALVPVEPVGDRRPGPHRRRSGGDGERAAVQRHELPCRRHRRAAGPRRPVGDRLPERRAQRADRDQRGDLADRGMAKEYRPGFRRRRRVPRRARARSWRSGTLDDAPFAISAYYDRVDHPPRGREGGQDGAAGSGRSWPRAGRCAARASRPCR